MTEYASRRVILIADDQDFIRSLLNSTLRELGYRTEVAADGNQAMQHLAPRIHAAILDHHMTSWTGLQLLRAIRSGQTRCARDLPVLLLTGHADEKIVQVASQLDVSALLSKPVSKAQLKERLEAATSTKIALKPAGGYAAVDLNPRSRHAGGSKMPNAWVPRDETVAATGWSKKRYATKTGRTPGFDVHYSRVKPGMILARDIYSTSGSLLLAAGSEIDQPIVKRLVKICETNPEMTYVRVAATKTYPG